MSSEIRWVGLSQEWLLNGYTLPYIGLPPTASDLLERVNEILEDSREYSHCISDWRMKDIQKVAEFIDELRVKGWLKDKNPI